MIKTIYGEVTKEQVQRQKKSIHDAIHWLLIYKDPKIMETGKYKNINEVLSVCSANLIFRSLTK